MADRLGDADVEQRLARLDDLLDHVEQVPGPTTDAALDAVRTLTEVYGEALARILRLVDPERITQVAADELLSHLLVLHGLHPGTVAERVERALDAIRAHGGEVELAGIEAGVARVRVPAAGCQSCSSTTETLEQVVTESVLALAPELSAVETVREPAPAPEPSLIPAEALLRRTASAGRQA